jgi:hypothetical protein
MSQLQNVSRDTKVDLAFGALATATTIVTLMTPVGLPFMAARVIGTVGANLLGAEAVKAGLNWLNRRRETEDGKAAN